MSQKKCGEEFKETSWKGYRYESVEFEWNWDSIRELKECSREAQQISARLQGVGEKLHTQTLA